MDITKIPVGKKSPDQINVLIEIPMKSGQVKYEFNKRLGIIEVDRFMQTELEYPCNYGFMPNTLSGDGDPIDVLVYTTQKLHPGVLIKVRPIAVLITEDESGSDEKILAVPIEKIDPSCKEINSHEDLPKAALEEIVFFFENYKKAEAEKWVKVTGWEDAVKAKEIINLSVENFKSQGGILDTLTEFKNSVLQIIKEFNSSEKSERRDSRGGSFDRDRPRSRDGGGSRDRSSSFSRDRSSSFSRDRGAPRFDRGRDDRGRGRDDRGGSFDRDRPRSRDGGSSSSEYGDRFSRPHREGSSDRDNRSRDFGDRPRRSFEGDRPREGSFNRDRSSRPSYSRDDRREGGRDSGSRDFRSPRSYEDRDSTKVREDKAPKFADTLKVKKKENE